MLPLRRAPVNPRASRAATGRGRTSRRMGVTRHPVGAGRCVPSQPAEREGDQDYDRCDEEDHHERAENHHPDPAAVAHHAVAAVPPARRGVLRYRRQDGRDLTIRQRLYRLATRPRGTVPLMGKNGKVIAAVYKAKTPNIYPNKISG